MTTKQRLLQSAALCVAIFLFSAFAQPLVVAHSSEKQKAEKPYALIFGTAYGPDDRPFYGAKITIHPVDKKRPSWDLVSDHRGEFAARVNPGPRDYLVRGEADYAPEDSGVKPQKVKNKRLKCELKVHVDNEERVDISVHLN